MGGIKINGMNIEKKEFHVLSKLIMQIANITIMKTEVTNEANRFFQCWYSILRIAK